MASNGPCQSGLDDRGKRVGILSDIAFPEAKHYPSCSLERLVCLEVPLDVARDLRHPVVRIISGAELAQSVLQVAAVPVVPIAKYCNAASAKNDIRVPGQLRRVQPVAKTEPCQSSSQQQLALGVALPA
jgi:hypothetical protein